MSDHRTLPAALAGALLLALAVGCTAPDPDSDPDSDPATGAVDHAHFAHEGGVGTVHFPTSCSEEAQPAFERGVAALHSFWLEEAERRFSEAAEVDPECAMAHWGRAMTFWGNPMTRAAPPEALAVRAEEAVERARALGASATPRERAWIEAAAALYDGYPEVGHLERMRAHEAAMRSVMEAHPDDPEAAIFYGRIVVGNAPPDDLTYARQLHAAEVMEPIFEAQPEHPGLAHYLIHAYDAPPIAERGLDAALRYADIAPDAPHALHMPTHIFTRVGKWEESIELNARSAAAEPDPDAAVHPMDYMVYAYLQLGRIDEARAIVDRAEALPDRWYGGLLGYNFAAMKARFALERDAWEEARALEVPEGAPPYVEGVTRFARGLGAARSGDVAAAEEEARALDHLREAADPYWAVVIEANGLAVRSWIALAEGDEAEAVGLAREAARLEGTVEKHPVTPGPLLPAGELLGDLLLALGDPAGALEAYEATLERERNRARAHAGALRAAEAAGVQEAAERHRRALGELHGDG